MNNIEHLLSKSRDFKTYARGYLGYMSDLLGHVDIESIAAFAEELEKARRNQNTVFVIGNGGSASTASHMANDFALGSGPKEDGQPYRILSLTDNVAKLTAIANDYGYERVFLDQLKVHYKRGDKLVVISASGNSANLICAAAWVKRQGGVVIGLLGFDGGKIKKLCDIYTHVITPKGEYGPVEDAHVMIDHLIYTWLHYKEKKKRPK
jgi:D-sedoheptulose 7-phosphate isomerase